MMAISTMVKQTFLIFIYKDKNKANLSSDTEAKISDNLIQNQETDSMAEIEEKDDNFYIFRRYEISKLSGKVYGKPVYYFVVAVMVSYLYIGVTSNGIIAGNSLSVIIGKSLGDKLPDYGYHIIVSSFYFISLIIALNNINKLKQLSIFIVACRFIIIFIVIGSCIYSIVKFGAAKISEIPQFETPNITIMIGNSLFFFMSHHSMPGMVENFTPQKNLIKLLVISYISSLIIMLTFGYLALFAFGQYKNQADCDYNKFPCAIQV